MSKFLHDADDDDDPDDHDANDDDAKAIAIPRFFSENSRDDTKRHACFYLESYLHNEKRFGYDIMIPPVHLKF